MGICEGGVECGGNKKSGGRGVNSLTGVRVVHIDHGHFFSSKF